MGRMCDPPLWLDLATDYDTPLRNQQAELIYSLSRTSAGAQPDMFIQAKATGKILEKSPNESLSSSEAIPDIITFIAEAKRNNKSFSQAVRQMTTAIHPTLLLNIIIHYQRHGLKFTDRLDEVLQYQLDPLDIVLGAYYDNKTLHFTASYPVIVDNFDGTRKNRHKGYIWIIRVLTIASYDLSKILTATQAWTIFVAILTVNEHNIRLQQKAQNRQTIKALTKLHKRSIRRPQSTKKPRGAQLLGKC